MSAPDNSSPGGAAEKCPVDHNSREVWLQQARAAQAAGTAPPPLPPHHPTPTSATTSTSSWNPLTWWSTPAHAQKQPTQPPPRTLNESRVVSSIPRSSSSPTTTPTGPVNHEVETGADPRTGNWVYPSERQFFEALQRKGTSGGARPVDMRTVVPIHNAVNERAWAEIREWEAPHCAACPLGPKLASFSGLAAKTSPRARLNALMGYTAPFDRHDWVVDRCGTRVEYVIDFYAGRPGTEGQKLNFYLDVRPKLNTWEGIKMRFLKAVGAV